MDEALDETLDETLDATWTRHGSIIFHSVQPFSIKALGVALDHSRTSDTAMPTDAQRERTLMRMKCYTGYTKPDNGRGRVPVPVSSASATKLGLVQMWPHTWTWTFPLPSQP